jgi:orotidine-5'-phosphate decarboxylase
MQKNGSPIHTGGERNMDMNKSQQKLDSRIQKVHSLLCLGTDPDITKLPERFLKAEYPQFEFGKWIIEQTHEFVCAYKPNFAFYEAQGSRGMQELQMTMEYLREHHPDIFTIADAKRGDIGNTNESYAAAIFDLLGFDAITLHPYVGREGLAPFLQRTDKMSIILCRTSNPGAGEFQDLSVDGKQLWQVVAERVHDDWNANENCMLVVGATYPAELKKIREIVGDMTLLIPGIGAQGGDVEKTVKVGMNSKQEGMIISTSRAVIFADDPAAEAKKLMEEINGYRT